MPDKILVTGATGFIGSRLVARLREAGYAVCCHAVEDGDLASCALPFKGVRHVFHLAARTFVPDSWREPRSFYSTNVLGTVNVLDHCRNWKAGLTFMSSYVYGSPRCLPLSEDHPLEAPNPYSHTKILGEEVARFYARHFGVRVVVVRPFNVYGPGQPEHFLIPTLARQILDPEQPEVRVADLRPKRDFVYVDDVIALLAATLEKAASGVYNAGSGCSVGIPQLVDIMNGATGQSKPLRSDDRFRQSEVLDVVADTSRAARELGWQARVPLPEGIARVLSAWPRGGAAAAGESNQPGRSVDLVQGSMREKSMEVPFMDLRVGADSEREALIHAVQHVLAQGQLLLGPEVCQLEAEVAKRCGCRYAVGVASGSVALLLGLRSLGIGAGDEVITTALSWIATANAISSTGATPVFADIRDDLNIDPESICRCITPRTKAILPVHWTGKVCPMPEIMALARERGLLVVEDAAQAFSATHEGRCAGSFGDVGCFSMNPMKVFGACGEAGMVVTDREDLYHRLVSLRYLGTVNREECVEVSLNQRLDTLQAAILLTRLSAVDRIVEARRTIARYYDERLAGVVGIPVEAPGERDVYYTYTIRTDRRDELQAFLQARGIESRIQHRLLMPQQPVYRDSARGEFPRATELVKRVLCIPAHEKLEQMQVEHVAASIRQFHGA